MDIDRVYNWRDRQRQGLYLVDRLWPRGVKKESLDLAGWPKELTPSSGLRREFHNGLSFADFREQYEAELEERKAAGELDDTLAELRNYQERVTEEDAPELLLLYAAKEKEHNHAVVLRDWLAAQLEG
ncbi:DUF488 family protein [uncultured Corynebacterium sp.]|uniref:DUF488 domain-containing protein n=1 Tax=uncultured Corynebacterium sp. TaxID=159447 RepID=UPI0025F1DAC0|nr:DUF488 family protein [uncultured Corynebacterium sp.]